MKHLIIGWIRRRSVKYYDTASDCVTAANLIISQLTECRIFSENVLRTFEDRFSLVKMIDELENIYLADKK